MLQTDLIYGIQKKIKEGKVSGSGGINVLEEASGVDNTPKSKEILLENYYNPGIISGISAQVKNSKKKIESKRALITEAFHLNKAEKKLNKDITYFNYLFENFVPDAFKEDYGILLESIFEDTIRLYQECDVTPRVISIALDSNELTESQVIDLYKNALNYSIKENYTKPLLSGKISELYENEIRSITTKLLQESVDADAEQIRIYLPFEEALYRFNREVIIPQTAESRINSFMEGTTSEYTDLLEESAEDILKAVEKKIKLLTSMISPDMFNKAVDVEGVDAPKMAGISIAIDKNFDDEEIIGDEALDDEAEAAEELADDEEAEMIDSTDSDIASLENGARDETGLATDTDELEGQAQEDKSELSPSEDSVDDDQPGAVEGSLALSDSNQGDTGHADNKSDVELQGNGNDNGEDIGSSDATLPGSATTGTSVSNDVSDSNSETKDTGAVNDSDLDLSGDKAGAGIGSDDVSDDDGQGGSDDKALSTSSNSLPADVAELPGKADESTGNTSDVSNSKGTASPTRVTSEEVGEDNDDYNAGGGSMVDSEDEEVNTETMSEDQMSEVEKEKDEVNGATTPRL